MFTYPALLWLLPILGAVILIHLINMLRHRRVEWAAMEFVLASYKKSRTRILFQQLLLMLLRTLAVAAIILMFASPQLEGHLAQWLSGRGTHHIILLDDSYSLNERNLAQGGVPLFDDAVAVIQQIAQYKPNDRLTLLKLSTAEPLLHELPLHTDGLQTIQNVLANLQPSSVAHEPSTMLTTANDLVRQTVGLNPVVYFLSDFRRRNWAVSQATLPDQGEYTPILGQIEAIRQHGGTVRMIRIAQAEQPNLGIEHLHLVEGIHAADVDILLDATIANYGHHAAENVLITLFVNDQMRSQRTVPTIPPGGKTVPPIRFPVRVSGSEANQIEVRLQPDALPDDNHRYLALQVPDAIEILLIAPPPSAGSDYDAASLRSEASAQFVRVALAPGGARSGILVRQELPAFLAEQPLQRFSAIFLLDLPVLEPLAIRALENYVSAGGGVAFFPGANTDLEFVRNHLYKAGTGLFPAAPMMVQELLPDYLTNAADIRVAPHPIFRLFSDTESPLLGTVIVDRYLAVELQNEPSVNVWATLRNDAPLVLEKPFGAGRTMTFLTSASPVWNNWARNPSYVVVLLELAAWLSKRPEQSRSFLVGDALDVQVDPMEYEERVRIALPIREGESYADSVQIDAVSGIASFARTERPGFYAVHRRTRSGAEHSELKAVNVNPLEGDIRQLDVTEIMDILRPVRQPLETLSSFGSASDFSGSQSVSDWLLYAVILFLLAEMFLAGRMVPPLGR